MILYFVQCIVIPNLIKIGQRFWPYLCFLKTDAGAKSVKVEPVPCSAWSDNKAVPSQNNE